MLTFERQSAAGIDRIGVEVRDLIVAGWTGRDEAALRHHAEELAAIGVPMPSTMPVFYRNAATQVTQTDHLQVLGPDTSGEIEPVVVALQDGLWLTVGSDHTDRKAETLGIALSKQLCGKVVGRHLWKLDEVTGDWARLTLESTIVENGRPMVYQSGSLAAMRTPDDLIYRLGRSLQPGTVMFCGTIGAIGGIRPASRFDMVLTDPVRGRSIRHGYGIEALPVIA
jgi:hypothetical protein